MGKKMKLLPFLTRYSNLNSWPFPSCGNIKTLSFRNTTSNHFYKDDNFRTFNSAFIHHITTTPPTLTPPDSFFTPVSSSSNRSFSTISDDNLVAADPIDDSVLRGLRSDRLFFEPEQSCSLLQQHPHKEENGWVEESEALGMESNNPCEDFRKSMEEMVEAHGLKDWEGLEELLGRYLKINAETNHGYIMGAFIDLLVNLSFISSSTTTTTNTNTNTNTNNNNNSPSSPLSLPSSSLNTTSLSSLFDHGDDDYCNDDAR